MGRQDLLSFVLIGNGFNQKWKGWEVRRWKEKNRTSHSFNLACFRITFHSLAVLHYLILWTCCAQSHNQMHFCLKCSKVLAWKAWGSYFGNVEAIQNTKPSSKMLEKALFTTSCPPPTMFPMKFPSPAYPSLTTPRSGVGWKTHTASENPAPAFIAEDTCKACLTSESSGHNRDPCVRADISSSFWSLGFLAIYDQKQRDWPSEVSTAELDAASCLLEERHEALLGLKSPCH